MSELPSSNPQCSDADIVHGLRLRAQDTQWPVFDLAADAIERLTRERDDWRQNYWDRTSEGGEVRDRLYEAEKREIGLRAALERIADKTVPSPSILAAEALRGADETSACTCPEVCKVCGGRAMACAVVGHRDDRSVKWHECPPVETGAGT